MFTAAPALVGGAGNSGTSTVSIVTGTIGAGGASGSTSAGTDFVTYNPPTGAVNGLRPLLAGEYAAAPAANVNLRVSSNLSTDTTVSINSLLLTGGITYNPDSAGGANTLTIASGNVLSVGGTNTIQPTITTGAVAFGANEVKLFTVSDLTLGSNAPITGTALLGKSGAGTLLESRAVARTGGIVINSGTWRTGIANSFTSQAVTVRAPGTLDLNGFSHTVSGLNLDSGATSGALVSTGAGTLTLGGNLALNVNGTAPWDRQCTRQPCNGCHAHVHHQQRRGDRRSHGRRADQWRRRPDQGGCGHAHARRCEHLHGRHQHRCRHTQREYSCQWRRRQQHRRVHQRRNQPAAGRECHAAVHRCQRNHQPQLHADRGPDQFRQCCQCSHKPDVSGASTATTGALAKTGAGTLTLSGTNLHTGLTTVSGGTLAYGANNALDVGAVTVTNGATLDIGTFSDTVGVVTLTNGTITGTTGVLSGTGATAFAVANGSISAILGGTGGLTKTTAGTVTLTRANTYTGVTTVNAGLLGVSSLANGGVASNIGASTSAAGNLVLGGGIVQYTGASASIDRNYSLTAGTTSSIDVSTAATNLTIAGASAATTGALAKLGDGTLTLTGNNANTGTTTIRTGTLQVGNGGATGNLGTGAVVDQGRLVVNRSNATDPCQRRFRLR